MNKLFKADLYRLFKSKLTIISLILSVVVPLTLALIYLGVRSLLLIGDESDEIIKQAMGANTMMQSTFSLTNNFGIVVPIFASILVLTDVTSGTVRNKIIHGYNRHVIFASHFTSILTYCALMMGTYALCTAGFGLLILGPGTLGNVKAVQFVYFYVLGMLGLITVAAISCCFSLGFFHGAGAIILPLVMYFFFNILATVLSISDKEIIVHLVRFLPNSVIQPGLLASGFADEIKPIEFLEALGGIGIFGGGFYAIGTFTFSHKDLK